MQPTPFAQPIYVTRPLLPPIESYFELLRGAWDRQRLTNSGDFHVALESRLAQYLEVPRVAVTSNGTTALQLICRALGLSGEVITTPFTFPATAEVLTWLNLTPVFADIDDVTLTLDPSAVERAISAKTTAILGVHVYGIPCHLAALDAIAKRHGLKLLYDGAHAFGTRINGRSILASGDATALSFHATKLFHTAEGGAVVTADADLHERIELLRNFGIRDETTVSLPGINGKMNELQAALGLTNLKFVDAERAARLALAEIYRARLNAVQGFSCVATPAAVELSNQYFAIRIDDHARLGRDDLYEALKAYNVFARRYFYPLCSTFPFYRHLPSSSPDNLPVAHRVANEILCLPFYGALGAQNAHRLCDIIEYEAGG